MIIIIKNIVINKKDEKHNLSKYFEQNYNSK